MWSKGPEEKNSQKSKKCAEAYDIEQISSEETF